MLLQNDIFSIQINLYSPANIYIAIYFVIPHVVCNAHPKSVRNRRVIGVFGGAFYVVTMFFGFFHGCRGFCHRTESDPFLFLMLSVTGKAWVTCREFPALLFLLTSKHPLLFLFTSLFNHISVDT